jgi:hypothetical protein
VLVLVIVFTLVANDVWAGTTGVVDPPANFKAPETFLLGFEVKDFDHGCAETAARVSWFQNTSLWCTVTVLQLGLGFCSSLGGVLGNRSCSKLRNILRSLNRMNKRLPSDLLFFQLDGFGGLLVYCCLKRFFNSLILTSVEIVVSFYKHTLSWIH